MWGKEPDEQTKQAAERECDLSADRTIAGDATELQVNLPPKILRALLCRSERSADGVEAVVPA